MLARLQQALTLGFLLLLGVWIHGCVRNGQPLLAGLGAVVLLGAHALVLGLEFVLLYRIHAADPTPRATVQALFRAWWGEVISAPCVFCWRQPFRSGRWPNLLPAGPNGPTGPAGPTARRGVVFVHGFVCNRGLWNPWLAQLTAQGTPFIAVNLEPVFCSIDRYALAIDAAVGELQRCTGLPPVVVAHSMGGLAVRAWWALPHNSQRVHHAITIGTPHQGTWLARFATTVNSRQMQQGSRWLYAVAATEPASRARSFTCFYSHCDNIVFPAAMATLPGADNRHLPGVAHVHMADRPEPMAELQHWLQPQPVAVQ